MEITTNYKAVGWFVLGAILALIIFLLWVSDVAKSHKTYQISFKGSVSGLQIGSDVKYQGVLIGSVKHIAIKPSNTEVVEVLIDIDSNIPIREDNLATLEFLGLTGTAIIQINGGNQTSPLLKVNPGRKYPKIKSQISVYETITDSLPQILKKISKTMESIGIIFNDYNRENIKLILQNLVILSNDAIGFVNQGKQFLNDNNAKLFNGLLIDVQKTIHTYGTDIPKLLRQSLVNVNATFANTKNATKDLQTILKDTGIGIRHLSGDGMILLNRFLSQASDTLATFKRIGDNLERSPVRFLTNDPREGYVP